MSDNSTSKVSDAKRMELICSFIKTGQQPEGFKITETKAGKYRLTRTRTQKEALKAERERLKKRLQTLEEELSKLEKDTGECEKDDNPKEDEEKAAPAAVRNEVADEHPEANE